MDKKEKIKKLTDEHKKYAAICMKEVLNVFENKGMHPITMYQILYNLVDIMEKEDPKMKLARMITEKIVKDMRQKMGDPIPEARLRALSNQMNKRWLGDKKATVWVCGMKGFKSSKKAKCTECKGVCYYESDPDKDMLKKGAKKVCLKCVVTNPKYSKDLNKEQKEIMKGGLK